MMYRSEDVQQILQMALTQTQEDEFSPQQLQEMAAELGITPATLQSAEQAWRSQQEEQRQRQILIAQRRKTFQAHLVPFLAVNTFLVLLNLATSPTCFWAIYPLAGWGLGLFLHGWDAFQANGKHRGKFLQTCCSK